MFRFLIITLALSTLVSVSPAQQTYTVTIPARVVYWASMTGNDLYEPCLAWEKTENNGGEGEADTVIKGQSCYSFIMGVINAYPACTSFPKGTRNEQIVDVAILYLKQHPADRGKDARELILTSEEEAFNVKWLLFSSGCG